MARQVYQDAYSDDGKVWHWLSNNAVCPLDACEKYGIPCDKESQKVALSAYYDEIVSRLREQANAEPSDEERYEMRAAFGPGVEVVNILTGRRTRT